VVSGSQYFETFGFDSSHKWRNIGIMIAIALAYLLAAVVGSETRRFTPQGGAPLVFTKRADRTPRKKPSDKEDDVEKTAPALQALNNSGICAPGNKLGELALTWRDINVNIGEAEILKGISGFVRRGELTALCGASGAGKTTLLTALSQTNFAGVLQGEVLVDGKTPDENYRKTIGLLPASFLPLCLCRSFTLSLSLSFSLPRTISLSLSRSLCRMGTC
jgi:ABC-type multidrug transport system fused ATPase/permease subunit